MNGLSFKANLHTADAVRPGFQITVISAVGYGRTLLSAFDDALFAGGVHGYNLIPLSSVIPAAAEVIAQERFHAPDEEYGAKLFVVKADARSDEPGAVVAAGLGWLQADDRRGVFVEHHAVASRGTREAVEGALGEQIVASLCDLAVRRDIAAAPDRVRSCVVSAAVTTGPACALVLAVYQAEAWRGSDAPAGGSRR